MLCCSVLGGVRARVVIVSPSGGSDAGEGLGDDVLM